MSALLSVVDFGHQWRWPPRARGTTMSGRACKVAAPFRVALVGMPFGTDPGVPSIQLGLLQAIAERAGFPTETYHLYVDLAQRLGRRHLPGGGGPPRPLDGRMAVFRGRVRRGRARRRRGVLPGLSRRPGPVPGRRQGCRLPVRVAPRGAAAFHRRLPGADGLGPVRRGRVQLLLSAECRLAGAGAAHQGTLSRRGHRAGRRQPRRGHGARARPGWRSSSGRAWRSASG